MSAGRPVLARGHLRTTVPAIIGGGRCRSPWVGDKDVAGLDHLTLDADGRITTFRVMIRPRSRLIATAQATGSRLEADPVPGAGSPGR